MNYIELINHYWQLREQGILTGAEGDLYMYLLHVSNKLGWKNPFNQSNALICAILNTSEPTLIRHRNTLKQLGLITFESGKAIKRNTQYYLNNLSSSIRGVDSGFIRGVDSSVGEKPLDYTKRKPKKKKPTPLPPSQGGGEKLDVDPLNSKAREVFETHFLNTYGEPYYWTAKDAGSMTGLLGKLKFRRQQKGLDESAAGVLDGLKSFLESIKSGWVHSNFSVPNINSKFNEILTQIKNDTGKATDQPKPKTYVIPK